MSQFCNDNIKQNNGKTYQNFSRMPYLALKGVEMSSIFTDSAHKVK